MTERYDPVAAAARAGKSIPSVEDDPTLNDGLDSWMEAEMQRQAELDAAVAHHEPPAPVYAEESLEGGRPGHFTEGREYYYVPVRGQVYEAWDIASAIVERLPVSFTVGHPIAIALEYIIRAGLKKPDVAKDLGKAVTALQRAIKEHEAGR